MCNIVLASGVKQSDWVIYTYTHIYLLFSFPMQAVTEHWTQLPDIYSRALLVIYFIHSIVPMPTSSF